MVAGVTGFVGIVGPLLHTYELPPEAVSVTVVPLQTVSFGEKEIAAVGDAITFTVMEAVSEHPAALVAVTV